MNPLQHVSRDRKDTIPSAVFMARSRFGRFKPEERVSTRRADVPGNKLQSLRDLRKMIETMNPEDVMNMITFYPKLNTFEALALAKREGALIVPNSTYDRILTETSNPNFLNNSFVWTGTLILYEVPGKVFGETLVYVWVHDNVQYSISFNIPDEFRGRKDCALVVQHPDFDLLPTGPNSYRLNVTDVNMLHLIEKFPSTGGTYPYEEQFRIPVQSTSSSNDQRWFWCVVGSCYIGLVVRGGDNVYVRRLVNAGDWASYERGVAVIK